jgi:hypothetical protein
MYPYNCYWPSPALSLWSKSHRTCGHITVSQLILPEPGPRQRCLLWSKSHRTCDHIAMSQLILPEPAGPRPCIYISRERGGPFIPPGIGFELNCCWLSLISPRHGSQGKHIYQTFFYCCTTWLSLIPHTEYGCCCYILSLPSNDRCLQSLLSNEFTCYNMKIFSSYLTEPYETHKENLNRAYLYKMHNMASRHI